MRRHVRLIQLDPPSLAHVRCPTEYMLQQVIARSSRQVPCVKHYQGLEVPSSRPPRAASSMLFQSAVSLAVHTGGAKSLCDMYRNMHLLDPIVWHPPKSVSETQCTVVLQHSRDGPL